MRRWPLALWVALVLALHAWAGWQWSEGLRSAHFAPPERLQLRLTRPMPLQTPAVVPTLSTRKLAMPGRAGPARSSLPDLSDLKAGLAPLPTVDALEHLPELPALAELDLEDGTGVGSEWPLSTRLRYSLTGFYQGPVHGDAEVEWLRQGAHYQVRLKLQIGPSLAPLASRELVSDGIITKDGVSPRRYDESTRLLLGRARQLTLQFDERSVQLAQGARVPAPAGVQDSASQFVQLAWMLLTGRASAAVGQVIELPLALPQRVLAWRYEVVANEQMETAVGVVEAWHLRPLGPMVAGALRAEVWLVPQIQYLPAQILIRQDETTWIKLNLSEPPLQEELQIETENAASQPQGSPP